MRNLFVIVVCFAINLSAWAESQSPKTTEYDNCIQTAKSNFDVAFGDAGTARGLGMSKEEHFKALDLITKQYGDAIIACSIKFIEKVQ